MKKSFIQNLIYVVLPMFIAFPFYITFRAPFFVICGLCYFVILIFIVPGVGEDTLNYRTKTFDHTYKVQRKKEPTNRLSRVIILVLSILLCILFTYLELK